MLSAYQELRSKIDNYDGVYRRFSWSVEEISIVVRFDKVKDLERDAD